MPYLLSQLIKSIPTTRDQICELHELLLALFPVVLIFLRIHFRCKNFQLAEASKSVEIVSLG